ncbi:hypothetical protein SAMN05192574_11581 [Mucilaginibacter gossypiicola]|uniref:Lipoprotein n=1 Tax=Mucilaginibacter gossypiicola TaxID=551995 RepID=A0A1H8TEC0_9SPHI|nr:hypothetical protein SAMN05192574_11581 [Mucilaginibacter gossypiicola]
MKKLVYIALIAAAVATVSSCSNKLCPAYGSYPKTGR